MVHDKHYETVSTFVKSYGEKLWPLFPDAVWVYIIAIHAQRNQGMSFSCKFSMNFKPRNENSCLLNCKLPKVSF